MAAKKNKTIILNLKQDRVNTGSMSMTPDDLRELKVLRQTKGIERREILRQFPQLDEKAYAVLTIKKIDHMLRHQPYENTIWVAFNRKR